MRQRLLWGAMAFVLAVLLGFSTPVLAKAGSNVGQFDRARELVQQGGCTGAIDLLTQEVKLNPGNQIAFKLRGYCYQQLKESDAALADYSRVIELAPISADAYVDRGLAHGFRGEYELAIADYDKALAIEPADARAWNARGVAYCRQGFSEEGRLDFERAAELSRAKGDRELYRVARRAAHRLCLNASPSFRGGRE
ncbi:MAG: tetratricopeptide repeat protein [Cyanobacteria bacterium P01_D01_bin.123]